jgi:hypothetical protein
LALNERDTSSGCAAAVLSYLNVRVLGRRGSLFDGK